MTFGKPLRATAALPTDFANAVDDIEYANGYVQVHMTIKRLPTFTKQLEFVNGTVQSWLVAYIKGPSSFTSAWQQSRAGPGRRRSGRVLLLPVAARSEPRARAMARTPAQCSRTTSRRSSRAARTRRQRYLMVERMIDTDGKGHPRLPRPRHRYKVVFTQQYFEKTFNATEGDFSLGSFTRDRCSAIDRFPVGTAATRPPSKTSTWRAAACHPGPRRDLSYQA